MCAGRHECLRYGTDLSTSTYITHTAFMHRSIGLCLSLCFCYRVILCKTADHFWHAQARILIFTWTSMQMNSGNTTSGEHLSNPCSLAIKWGLSAARTPGINRWWHGFRKSRWRVPCCRFYPSPPGFDAEVRTEYCSLEMVLSMRGFSFMPFTHIWHAAK